ncbi:hypothetical protein KQ306_08320 [Synechococcus sp. CS-1324]|uniref:hypothetical protein n=1 Tax=Synechococcus sp. CS-1324 TaxID=2847980 RepID=UPI000DB318E4|nr:hypothetical protein [Synechococcus sp. CS-1324]MCT0230854.1 hypothetical protein [Synechococcus sp. CS-1324]PZV00695.1 MAG: hypothetical protein DCF24_06345 [Cyanobium sp.]PZV03376.1 MAG: hypothetical protein DCF23_09645 [Cyanobium sp.]
MATQARTLDQSNIVMRFCQLAVNTEVERSGLAVPAGLTQFTCQCFLRHLDLGRSLNAAQVNCKQEAIRRYRL